MRSVFLCFLIISVNDGFVEAQQRSPVRGLQAIPPQQRKAQQQQKVMCGVDTLMIYQDCRICVCPRAQRVAKCYRKSCDLRTKDSGQCPMTVLRMDDNKLCQPGPNTVCRTDNDCPDKLICCFDFCKGNQCVNPNVLEPGSSLHRGRGYP